MAVDNAEKRKSAFAFLVPGFLAGIDPGPAGFDAEERPAAARIYAGITPGFPSPADDIDLGLALFTQSNENLVHITQGFEQIRVNFFQSVEFVAER